WWGLRVAPRTARCSLTLSDQPPDSTKRNGKLCFAAHVSGTEENGEAHGRGGSGVADESERTRLIADLTRLIREPTMPETTRHAGLTLIGWLARRRPDEAPHSLGIDEARQSERRIKAARAKLR